MNTRDTMKISKILESMQTKMAEEASQLRARVVGGRLPAADASNEADKMYQRLREDATEQIGQYLDSVKDK